MDEMAFKKLKHFTFIALKKNSHTFIAFNLQNNFFEIAAHSLRKAWLVKLYINGLIALDKR